MSNIRKNKRLKVSSLVSRLMNYDVVSFDIFDTLILRNVSDPKDIFSFLAPKYSLLDFGKLRVEIESKLRNKKQQELGQREINIFEIYEEMYKYTSIDPKRGVNNELEEEKKFCYANPYMKIVFDTLKQNNKKIIITSDMYLPNELMVELLACCGYEGYDKLFVSCDYNCSKRNMGLYEHIINNYLEEDETVIHIGDNYETDIICARKMGWDAYHYPQVKELGKPLNKIGMSYIIATYYSSIVNNFMYNGLYEEHPYNKAPYFYGFAYGGLFILGYVNWLHKKAVESNLDKLLFLSRDGYILKKVYDMLYNDIPSEYVYWSRQASMKSSIKANVELYNWQFIKRRRADNPYLKVETILKDMEFDNLIPKLIEKDLSKETKIGEEGVEEKLIELILENVKEINDKFEIYNKSAKKYYQNILNDSRKVGIIDIGWRGTGAISLKYLFNEWKFDCSVKAFVSGTYKNFKNRDGMFYLNKDIECYMFSPEKNTDLLYRQQNGKAIRSIVIEMFTSAPYPSFSKYTIDNNKNLELSFDYPEVENYKDIELTFKGELDFIKEYIKHLNGHNELLEISGRDAYLPLDYLMTGKRFQNFKKTYKNISYNRLIGGLKDENGNNFETFEDICKTVGGGKK